jgi:hypothetical protein
MNVVRSFRSYARGTSPVVPVTITVASAPSTGTRSPSPLAPQVLESQPQERELGIYVEVDMLH